MNLLQILNYVIFVTFIQILIQNQTRKAYKILLTDHGWLCSTDFGLLKIP
jgi:hypothetical protein